MTSPSTLPPPPTGPGKPPRLLYAILDSSWVSRDQWTEKCRQLLQGGADLIQLRAKKESPAERRELLEAILPLFAKTFIPLVINDDIDLCLSYPRLGLHVGQDDIPAPIARERLGPDRILGLSTHSRPQAEAAIALGETLSYFAVGPVFATPTKPDYTPVGLELVQNVANLGPSLPFFCIGGITRNNIRQVTGAGARNIVIVSDLLSVPDTASAVTEAKATLNSPE